MRCGSWPEHTICPPPHCFTNGSTLASADGSGGFDKSQLKKVEQSGGLSPKGYIPVMKIGDEVIRESSVLVQRVAELSATTPGATSLMPEKPSVADGKLGGPNAPGLPRSLSRMFESLSRAELIAACNTLPKSSRSKQLDALLKRVDAEASGSSFLAGERFSVADACLLPFLQRVKSEGLPSDTPHLRAYYDRCASLPAFSKTVVSSWWWWW